MLKPIQLALQLFFITLSGAAIQEPTLYKFCKHTYMDMLGDMPAVERIKNDYCKHKIEVIVENEKEAKSVCRRTAPFRVKEAAHESDGTVRCKWESRTTCVNNDDVLVYNRCFRLGQLKNASTANSGCNGKSSLHSVKSRDEAKFLSLFLPNERPVHVANLNSQRPFNMIDRSGLVLGTDGFQVSTSTSPTFVALNLLMLDLENISPGMLIEVSKETQLRPLCSSPSVLYGNKEKWSEEDFVDILQPRIEPGWINVSTDGSPYEPNYIGSTTKMSAALDYARRRILDVPDIDRKVAVMITKGRVKGPKGNDIYADIYDNYKLTERAMIDIIESTCGQRRTYDDFMKTQK